MSVRTSLTVNFVSATVGAEVASEDVDGVEEDTTLGDGTRTAVGFGFLFGSPGSFPSDAFAPLSIFFFSLSHLN